MIKRDFKTVRAKLRPKPYDSKLGPRIIIRFPEINIGFSRSLDISRISQNKPRTGLTIPKTVKGFPKSFSALRTSPTGPKTIRALHVSGKRLFATITYKSN
jgi:hypothetical protein